MTKDRPMLRFVDLKKRLKETAIFIVIFAGVSRIIDGAWRDPLSYAQTAALFFVIMVVINAILQIRRKPTE